ncbi:hypothetical protein [Haloarcula sp. 1CSR25-25]|uniref:hypothetical protein n=1 Tax=Haloarcula sp. 1CSR25-25 TaxID=2862545 RepID=UPI002894684A|nr:hypothetical protein [Haloarcula sp. 1CSR25-25]MDT3434650.1 hypothetical protein [Haloarcula sp. 1CSR25-25]
MPEPAVNLIVSLRDLIDENRESDINHIWQTLIDNGFKPTVHDDEIRAEALLFQPFEDTSENRELIQKCVKELDADFPELEIEYSTFVNGDPEKFAEKTCNIIINL